MIAAATPPAQPAGLRCRRAANISPRSTSTNKIYWIGRRCRSHGIVSGARHGCWATWSYGYRNRNGSRRRLRSGTHGQAITTAAFQEEGMIDYKKFKEGGEQ